MHKKQLHKYAKLLKFLKTKCNNQQNFEILIDCFDDKTIKFLCEVVKNGISKDHVSNLPTKQRNILLKTVIPCKRLLKSICKRTKQYGKKNI